MRKPASSSHILIILRMEIEIQFGEFQRAWKKWIFTGQEECPPQDGFQVLFVGELQNEDGVFRETRSTSLIAFGASAM